MSRVRRRCSSMMSSVAPRHRHHRDRRRRMRSTLHGAAAAEYLGRYPRNVVIISRHGFFFSLSLVLMPLIRSRFIVTSCECKCEAYVSDAFVECGNLLYRARVTRPVCGARTGRVGVVAAVNRNRPMGFSLSLYVLPSIAGK